jgi:hypothetical protein
MSTPKNRNPKPKKPYNKKRLPVFNSTFRKGHFKEYLDVDYVDQLSSKEQQWLNQFLDEYYNSYFRKGKEPLHTKEQRRQIYKDDYARRMDTMGTKFKAYESLDLDSSLNEKDTMVNDTLETAHPFNRAKRILVNSPENAVIDTIDLKRSLEDDQ